MHPLDTTTMPRVWLVLFLGAASLLAVAVSPSAAETEVDSCIDGNGNQTVDVVGCTTQPCILEKGTQVHIKVHFMLDASSHRLVHNVSGEIHGMSHSFVGIDGTDASGNVFDGNKLASFPLKANKSYCYSFEWEVPYHFPSITCYAFWSLVNEKEEKPVCFKVKIKLTHQKNDPPHEGLL